MASQRLCSPLQAALAALALAALAPAWSASLLVPSQYGTIQAAVNAAASGDTVVVSPGTYTESVVISGKTILLHSTDPDDDTETNNTIIQCPPGGTAAVTSSNASTSIAAYTQVAGFTIRGPHDGVVTGAGVHFLNNCHISDNSGDGVTCQGGETRVRYCDLRRNANGVMSDACLTEVAHSDVSANTYQGVHLTGALAGTVVWACEVHDNGSHGVLMDGGWIAESHIYDNGAVGIAVGGPVDVASNQIHGNEIGVTVQLYAGGAVNVSHNRVYANNSSIPASKGGGLYCYAGGGAVVKVFSNTFHGNRSPNGGGIWCQVADGSSLDIRNTILTSNSGYGIMRAAATGTVTIAYCDVWDNAIRDYYGTTSKAGLGNISVDPVYATAKPEELRLQSMAGHYEFISGWHVDSSNSPCIDAGDPATDCSNELAPNGGCVNLGWDGASTMAAKTPAWPVIVSKSPLGAGANARATVNVAFDRAMNQAATQAAFSLTPAVAGTFSWVGNELRFKPQQVLPALTSYTVKVGTGATSAGGVHLPLPKSWSFKTSGAPVVSGRYPTGTAVSTATKVKVTFNVNMDRASAAAAFSLTPAVAGRFSWNVNQMIFTPTVTLSPLASYRVTISTAAKSAAGVAMEAACTWTFKTAAAAPVPLAATAYPAGGGAALTLALGVRARVTAVVQNLAGREVALLGGGELQPGTHTLQWNGRNRTGARVPAGQYFLRVRVCAPDGRQFAAVAPLRLAGL